MGQHVQQYSRRQAVKTPAGLNLIYPDDNLKQNNIMHTFIVLLSQLNYNSIL